MSVSVVVKNAASTIGEGPHWDPASGVLRYVDIQAGDVHRYNVKTGEDTKRHLGKFKSLHDSFCIEKNKTKLE